jgi:hypothetical protein
MMLHPGRSAPGVALGLAVLILLGGAHRSPGGTPPFSVGLNYPWHVEGPDHLYGALFGEMTDARRAAVRSHLAEMAGDGITCLRIWLLADGWRWPERERERFKPLPPAFVEDLRWFLRAAHEHGIRVQPSIWDFYVNRKNRRYVADPAVVRELVDVVVSPLVAALREEPGLYGWDVMNEPDWIVRWWPFRRGPTEAQREEALRRHHLRVTGEAAPAALPPDLGPGHDLAVMRRFVKAHVDAIHAAGARATLGGAMPITLRAWKGLGLDEYQVHYYPPGALGFLGDHQFRLLPSVRRLGLDAPCILGEFPPNLRKTHLVDVLELVRDKGYAGAWAWSYFGHGHPEDLTHPFSYRARRSEFREFTSGRSR